MIKAIFYKEWIKCRSLLMLLLLVAVSMVTYLFISNANLLRTSGAVAIWSQIAEGSFTLFSSYITWFIPLSALVIAAKQYSVEMTHKRFKLTLHLPFSEARVIGAMQIFGVTTTLLIYAIIVIPSYLGLSIYYPSELVNTMIVAMIPHMLGGVACYFFAMWVIVEPILRRRVGYLLIAIVSFVPFTMGGMLGAMTPMIPTLLMIVAISVVAAYYSSFRFKDGAQN